ncbi:MAG: tRNA (adenosine(37)-N6)-threonylcarbamoyltransferase complex ATPase subunit type 1 TsaE [Thermotogae bacterium]|nr:tRNA (adenosine(37)-N6)-threonylcarbamoyltransferase complex ATPase subunit type 1 TsaE [Thermotogota bacterium]
MEFLSEGAEDTELIGAYVSCRFAHFKTFLLVGDLGSGKTTFVRGFLKLLGYSNVRSPSFTLINTYRTPLGTVHHVDLYRLESEEEFYTLGLGDVLGRETVLIEWAQRLPYVEGLWIEFQHLEENRRKITLKLP